MKIIFRFCLLFLLSIQPIFTQQAHATLPLKCPCPVGLPNCAALGQEAQIIRYKTINCGSNTQQCPVYGCVPKSPSNSRGSCPEKCRSSVCPAGQVLQLTKGTYPVICSNGSSQICNIYRCEKESQNGIQKKCVRGGCSGELCVEEGSNMASPCLYKPEFACYKKASCERINGTCQFNDSNGALSKCLNLSGKQNPPIPSPGNPCPSYDCSAKCPEGNNARGGFIKNGQGICECLPLPGACASSRPPIPDQVKKPLGFPPRQSN
jgi:eight-cysteine-cluster-containing protein